MQVIRIGNLRAVLVGMSLIGAASAQAQTHKSIGDWYGACDNLRSCSAYGFSSDENPVFLRLQRGGERDAEPHWTLGWSLDDPQPGTRVKLSFDEPGLTGLPGEPVVIDPAQSPVVLTIPSGDEAGFLASLRKAQAIRAELVGAPGKGVSYTGDTKVAVSLKGAVAMLIWLDEQQKRLDTATALIKTGPKPASAVPDPPPIPTVRAAPAQPGRAARGKVPAAVAGTIAAAKKALGCDADPGGGAGRPSVEPLSATAALWDVTCVAAAYNTMQLFFVVENGAARPARFELPAGSAPQADAPNELANASFDPKTMTLDSFDKGRGIGDCGTSGRWIWDGRSFRLLEFSDMPECRGVVLEAWPIVYRARREP